MTDLLVDVHEDLPLPPDTVSVHLIEGTYQYWHYLCDGVDDRGWGCGYRTLQTLCSWILLHEKKPSKRPVPSIPELQEALVKMQDKQKTFLGSRDWIGSFEVSLCLDYFYDVPGKIVHLESGADLPSCVDQLVDHFTTTKAPVMMGGDSDNSSKGVLGICKTTNSTYLLILDPHCSKRGTDKEELQRDGWIKWRPLESFVMNSFYNLCLPQYKARPP
ncbi:ufm1-specific protease 1 [Lingula anatina]|uniref:Ufm1-specific protease 1 n=1 Tax=Lingula anatina TaxID=7574 RepID=A0A1S3HFU5_LINAN|nr:ufm1-specific protease 1 [Lingula anatina]XP_013383915.1 ufm1-specific protease 1 [Lingula anatina]|eukprot:XP_013383909.1 ufm1-specific protease 1 [Lingula anatina]